MPEKLMTCRAVLRTAPWTTMLSTGGETTSWAEAGRVPVRNARTGKTSARKRFIAKWSVVSDQRSGFREGYPGSLSADHCPLRLRPGPREGAERQLVLPGCDIHLDLVAPGELAGQNLLAQGIFDVALDRALERPGSVGLVIAMLDQEIGRGRRELDLVPDPALHVLEQHPDDLGDVALVQRMEDDHVVQPVQEFGIEDLGDLLLDGLG